MHYAAAKLLSAAVPQLILCATYGPALHREAVRETVHQFAAKLFVVSCIVNADDAASRFRQRARGHAAVDLTEDKVRRSALDAKPFAGGLVLNTSELSEEDAVQQTLAYIGSPIAVSDINAWVDLGFRGPRT
jgi:hypothetical protein